MRDPLGMKRRLAGDDSLTRRRFLHNGLAGAGLLAVAPWLTSCGSNSTPPSRTSNIANLGPLGAPDANGIRLPAGFTSR